MRQERIVMGMPAIIEITDPSADNDSFAAVWSELEEIDQRFSTYKETSEISRINREHAPESAYSPLMKEVFVLAEQTKIETGGYFDIRTPDDTLDPSGIVKGWALLRAAQQILNMGFKDCYIDIGGDIQTYGKNPAGAEWSIGIRNPFDRDEIVKVIYPHEMGVATSGTAVRGQHIYNPHDPHAPISGIVSLTVIGPDVYEADRFATAAFAMGKGGIVFIEHLPGFEGYTIDPAGIATMTSGFNAYTTP
jgi:thiamine biosynthesis lipoprotein